MQAAIRTYPSVVPLLADKAEIALSGDIRGHAAFRIQTDRRWGVPIFPYDVLVADDLAAC